MRLARNEKEFEASYEEAKREAKACFGNDEVYVEKYIENPKHVEVQIAADQYGNCIHLYERDCSFQVGNQKMIEEAPCSCIDEDLRQRICLTAVQAAKAAGYDSIGTVEFLLDGKGNFYFMEMNTRIQVEHPITEMITGIDLVALQISLAQKEKLCFKQEDISIQGSALECRINAQDPKHHLKPSAGKIHFLNLPGGKGVRVDSALYQGMEVLPFYDSMLCKLITFSDTRQSCIEKMKNALEEFIAEGIETNESFHYQVLENEKFLNGRYSTTLACELLEG